MGYEIVDFVHVYLNDRVFSHAHGRARRVRFIVGTADKLVRLFFGGFVAGFWGEIASLELLSYADEHGGGFPN